MIRQSATICQADIRQSLELLHSSGDVFEIRILDACGRPRGVDAGYFNDLDAAAEAAAGADSAGSSGVYVTLNPVVPALLARANNRLVQRPKHTTGDAEIARRRWLLLDIDPDRPAGIAATEDERQAAMILAADIEDILRSRGFSYPLICSSGNGVYLLYRIDLPNNAETTETLKRFYVGLQTLLDGDYAAHIDTGVFNAARLIRVGGTTNRKGDDTADRPHRRCEYNPPIDECPMEVIRWG
jgi:hypothetical protein